MKKNIIALIMLINIATITQSNEIIPNTIKSADFTIHTETKGNFYGKITNGDTLEIKILQPQNNETQKIIEEESYLEIGNDKILPTKTNEKELQYLTFKISNLLKYAKTPEFKIKNTVRVKKTTDIKIGKDYNLTKTINKYEEYKKPSEYVESNDPTLQSKATLEFTSDSWIENAIQISEWINSNIKYDFENYYNETYSAKQTYNNKAGVCDEFANLTIAFGRIKGIPAKYVAGISFDGQRFANHGWAEFYNPETGWIPIDTTFAETGYVDAAHIEYSKSKDANKNPDMIIITNSKYQIEAYATTSEPEVTINSIERFSRMTKITDETPEKVSPNEQFEIKATIQNISNNDGIFPIKLIIHPDFKTTNTQKLIHLKAGETKKISWKTTAPNENTEETDYTYKTIIATIDGNIEKTITVTGKKDETKKEISIIDINPEIKENKIKITITLENPNQTQKIKIKFLKENETIEKEYELPNQSYYKIEETFDNTNTDTIEIKIYLKEEKTYKITIPKQKEETNQEEQTTLIAKITATIIITITTIIITALLIAKSRQ
jgi:transglutaminase-like putative cysteine protease